jgi:hypothetical protein
MDSAKGLVTGSNQAADGSGGFCGPQRPDKFVLPPLASKPAVAGVS